MPEIKKIYLLGAANPETIRMIQAVQRLAPNLQFPGFLDNDPARHGQSFFGYPVLGGADLVSSLAGPGVGFVSLVTGSAESRYESCLSLVQAGAELANFIHPQVDLTMTSWGAGNYVQEAVVVQASVVVGDNCSIHMGALIGHETVIGDSVFIAHGVSVSGCCNIGDGVFVGTNATILPRVKIGRWATIGAGSVITKDVPDYAVVVGNPGKVMRSKEPQYQNGHVRTVG